MGYSLARFLIRLFIRVVARVKIDGLEKLPRKGPFIATANHIGRLEVLMAYYLLDRKDIIMLVAEKYRENRFFAWFVKQVNGIYIDRYNADINALRETLKRLEQGGALAMAPEGTRSKSGELQPGHPGASYLASRSGVPVYPVGVVGTDDSIVKDHIKHLKRVDVLAKVGDPFTIPPIKGPNRDAQLDMWTEEIMCRIAALLPLEKRGVYANHPRLKELLNGGERLAPALEPTDRSRVPEE